jgi:intergrase/recombinase
MCVCVCVCVCVCLCAYIYILYTHIHGTTGQSERIRRIEEEVVVVADRVISVSGVLCDEVKAQLRVSQDKLRMVHNGTTFCFTMCVFLCVFVSTVQ